MVARLSPEKDQLNFVEAAGHLVKQRPRVRFVCVGAEPAGRRGYADEVRRRATAAGISDRIIWSGARSDVPAVMNALDLHVLASNAGEGCPNSVAEAMACAIPCVVTDVGDSARLVGPGGVVVPARDPEALADGCHRALTRAAEDRSLGLRLRRRIETRYSIDRMIDRTARVFEAALAGRSGRTPS